MFVYFAQWLQRSEMSDWNVWYRRKFKSSHARNQSSGLIAKNRANTHKDPSKNECKRERCDHNAAFEIMEILV